MASTIQLTLEMEDMTVAKTVKQILRQIKGVIKVSEKTSSCTYTQEEWLEKLHQSSLQAERGEVIAMNHDETIDQYVDRLLCTK